MRLRIAFATALAFILIAIAAPLVYSQELPGSISATSNTPPTSATAVTPIPRRLARPKPRAVRLPHWETTATHP